MNGINKTSTACIAAVSICLFSLAVPPRMCLSSDEIDRVPASKGIARRLFRQKVRYNRAKKYNLFSLYGIKKNMTVADIGSGTGQAAYIIADMMDGTGTVYATDLQHRMINYIKEQAEKKHLANVIPVLVTAEGLDEFYKEETFDLVLVNHVFPLPDSEYFKALGKSLTDDGRVIVNVYQPFEDIAESDFTDKPELIREFKSPEFSKTAKKYIRNSMKIYPDVSSGTGYTNALETNTAGVFNTLLHSPFLTSDYFMNETVFGEKVTLSQKERELIQLLSYFIGKELKVYRNYKTLGKSYANRARQVFQLKVFKINKILLAKRFKNHFAEGLVNPHADSDNQRVISRFKNAGYSLVKKSNQIPYENVYIYRKPSMYNDSQETGS